MFGELDFFSPDEQIPDSKRRFNVKALSDCELLSLSKESLYNLEKLYPTYIAEIFEFANYRIKKLWAAKIKGEQALRRKKRSVRSMATDKFKRGITKSKTAKWDNGKPGTFDLFENIDEIIISPAEEQKETYGEMSHSLKKRAVIFHPNTYSIIFTQEWKS